ncbi:MAG: hypothetical protein GDA36_10305 [Rhodobacteraceae bacterium]|nr:hypothetical protein [Paracoccaceae bacterium]
MTNKPSEQNIPVERLFLDLGNPRHKEVETEKEAIELLCSNEDVIPLARDIARYGLSPIDRLAVVSDNDEDGPSGNFVVAEGNRRLCALKLLTDPDLAPSKHKDAIEKAAADWTPIAKIPCVVFDDKASTDPWLERRHQGPLDGVGLKPWDAEQKARHSGGSSQNRVAQSFLDWAQQEGLINPQQRKGRLTTAQRYLNNRVMKNAMGIDATDPNQICRTRPEDDMRLLAQRFIGDLLSGEVTSRHKTPDIEKYAGKLDSIKGLTRERVDSKPLAHDHSTSGVSPNPSEKSIKTKPKRVSKISYDAKIDEDLKKLDNRKLISLYNSVTKVSAWEHTPLVAVGVWSFFETLTALLGREKASFSSFLNKQCLKYHGIDAADIRAVLEAIERIHAYGNTTKHHHTSATFSADQLDNDMTILRGLIVKLIAAAPRDP